jgi:hypothetical protein
VPPHKQDWAPETWAEQVGLHLFIFSSAITFSSATRAITFSSAAWVAGCIKYAVGLFRAQVKEAQPATQFRRLKQVRRTMTTLAPACGLHTTC